MTTTESTIKTEHTTVETTSSTTSEPITQEKTSSTSKSTKAHSSPTPKSTKSSNKIGNRSLIIQVSSTTSANKKLELENDLQKKAYDDQTTKTTKRIGEKTRPRMLFADSSVSAINSASSTTSSQSIQKFPIYFKDLLIQLIALFYKLFFN